jgi:hypothetical protein
MRSDAAKRSRCGAFFALINSLRKLTFLDSETSTVKTFLLSSLTSRQLSANIKSENLDVTPFVTTDPTVVKPLAILNITDIDNIV